jgi:outer membrane protease
MKTEPNPIIAGLQKELSEATRNAHNMREHYMKDLIREYGTQKALTYSIRIPAGVYITPMIRSLRSGDRAAVAAEKYVRQILRHVERYVT